MWIAKVLLYFSGLGVKLKIYIGLALAFAAIVGGAVLKGRSEGKLKERLDAMAKDRKNADEITDRVSRARRGDGVRKHKDAGYRD